MVIWIKEGTVGDLSPQMRKGHGRLAALYQTKRKDMFVTRRREYDSASLYGSLHYDGNAEDIFDPNKYASKEDVQKALGPDFDVVEYSWGYHCEYDPFVNVN